MHFALKLVKFSTISGLIEIIFESSTKAPVNSFNLISPVDFSLKIGPSLS